MGSILGLLFVGAVVSTAIKVGVLVVGAKALREHRRRSSTPATVAQADETPTPETEQPSAVSFLKK